MTILENPVFKHKKIKQKQNLKLNELALKNEILNAHKIPIKLKEQYSFLGNQIEEMPFRPEISEWIKCQYRMRQVIDHEVISFCLNPFHPGFQANMFCVYCMKKECDLNKITDENLFF